MLISSTIRQSAANIADLRDGVKLAQRGNFSGPQPPLQAASNSNSHFRNKTGPVLLVRSREQLKNGCIVWLTRRKSKKLAQSQAILRITVASKQLVDGSNSSY